MPFASQINSRHVPSNDRQTLQLFSAVFPGLTLKSQASLERLCICGGDPATFSQSIANQQPLMPAFFDDNFLSGPDR